MLRRLGVPARCVTGWVALEQMVGLHFWVEVKLKDRWIPIDPTFCQAPASAFRLKLGTSDLADLGSVMWDSAAKVFGNGQWIPEGTWTREIGIAGDTVRSPDGSTLRVPGATWRILEGMLILSASEVHHVSAIPRPYAGRLADGKRLQAGHRTGWWVPGSRNLFVDLGNGRWLRVDPITEREAFQLLDSLEDIAPHIR
jgi:hypothetical protein